MIDVLRKAWIWCGKALDEVPLALVRQSVPDFLSLWAEVVPATGRQPRPSQWSSGGTVDLQDSFVDVTSLTVVMKGCIIDLGEIIKIR